MPRPLRSLFPPGQYHVYARGVNRCVIFHNRADCLHFLYLLGRTIRRYRWTCWAFCLMGNHYHLVIETSQPGFSDGLQWLNGLYAARFNRIHGRVGHLFGGRFGAIAIESEEQLAVTCEYVFQNPVRAGLCGNAADWPWSRIRTRV
jgi:putative transposase